MTYIYWYANEPTANATQNSTRATQSAGDQSTSFSSGATESRDSSRDSVEAAKLDYQNAITSGHEVDISQKKSAYADALDAHTKVLENKDSQLQTGWILPQEIEVFRRLTVWLRTYVRTTWRLCKLELRDRRYLLALNLPLVQGQFNHR